MRYAFSLIALGCALVAIGVVQGGPMLVLVWLGGDFLLLGAAHWRAAHNIFGKRKSGELPGWSRLLFLPLLICNQTIWLLTRLFSSEAASNAVTENLSVGRRLVAGEIEPGFENYVDLTAEFSEPRAARRLPDYVCFPILDGAAPSQDALEAAIRKLRPGKTFIHCAQGHGRTGLFALAVLLSWGRVRDSEEGLRLLQAARPGIRLNRLQRLCIEAYQRRLRAQAPRPDGS